MNSKIKKISGWTLSGIVLLLMAASAIDKISGSTHSLAMTHSFGITPAVYRLLGVIELASVLLFIIPRTGILGLLLLSSYLVGAIATHLQHDQSIIFPAAIEALVWIAALIRYPVLWHGMRKHLRSTHSSTSIFPSFLPLNRPIKAAGNWSKPFTMVSR